jgi:AcrR family transcriptional regulator
VTDLEIRAPGRRDRKKQQTRAALVAAALRLVDERGLEHVTVEEISAAVDVSPRTFFNYFATKDEALIDDPLVGAEGVRERLRQVPPKISVVGAVLLALAPAIAAIQADQENWFTRMRVLDANPGLLPMLMARGAAAEREFVAAVAERTGVSAEHGFPQVAAAVTGAAFRTAMIRWSAGGGAHSLQELTEEAFGMVAAGLSDPTEEEDR